MKSVVAILLAVCCGCAQAEAYKWTDERGEAHFGDSPPPGVHAEKVINQEQIEQTEETDRRRPPAPPPAAGSQPTNQEIAEQIAECQRLKQLRDEYLLNEAQTNPSKTLMMGYAVGYVMDENEVGSNTLIGLEEIEAKIRTTCRD